MSPAPAIEKALEQMQKQQQQILGTIRGDEESRERREKHLKSTDGLGRFDIWCFRQIFQDIYWDGGGASLSYSLPKRLFCPSFFTLPLSLHRAPRQHTIHSTKSRTIELLNCIFSLSAFSMDSGAPKHTKHITELSLSIRQPDDSLLWAVLWALQLFFRNTSTDNVLSEETTLLVLSVIIKRASFSSFFTTHQYTRSGHLHRKTKGGIVCRVTSCANTEGGRRNLCH